MLWRKIYDSQDDILSSKKIVFILGPRQVGKTTFLKKMMSDIPHQYKQFLNLEDVQHHEHFLSFDHFTRFISLIYPERPHNHPAYLFLDEFHKVRHISPILKLIADEIPWLHVILSGSNNIAINRHITESFAGRKRTYTMWPLDKEEYLVRKEGLTKESVSGFINNPINQGTLEQHLIDMMHWGCFPAVVLAATDGDKQQELADLFDFWFNRDIIIETHKLYEFRELTKHLAYNNGNIVNYSTLAGYSHLSAPTVKQFIATLEETYIVWQQRPFFRNKHKEITKSPKIFFIDPGLRNYFVQRFSFSPTEYGGLFETIVLSDTIKSGISPYDIKFWRTNDERHEVDVIIESQQLAYECKYKNTLRPKDHKSINHFVKQYTTFDHQMITPTSWW